MTRPFTIVQFEQGSPDWLQWRLDGIGGSEAAIILGQSPWRTRRQLWDEKASRVAETIPDNPAMARGRALEPVVRDWVEKELKLDFPPCCVELAEFPVLRASLDGLHVPSDPDQPPIVLEIKSMGAQAFAHARQQVVPAHYHAQIQHNMLVVGAEKAIFAACPNDPDPNQPLPITYCEVKADPQWQEAYRSTATDFWRSILANEPPPPSKPGYIEVNDPQCIKAALDYARAAEVLAQAQAEADKAKAALLATLPEEADKAMVGHLLTVNRFAVQGRIDMQHPDVVEALSVLDLDKYRKPPTISTKIDLLGAQAR